MYVVYITSTLLQWHLGMMAKEYTPLYRGFKSHFGYWQGAEDYYDHTYLADGNVSPQALIFMALNSFLP